MSKEIERRTVYTIMARPINRAQFVVGKYVGLVGILLLNVVVMLTMYVTVLWLYRIPIQGTVSGDPTDVHRIVAGHRHGTAIFNV